MLVKSIGLPAVSAGWLVGICVNCASFFGNLIRTDFGCVLLAVSLVYC